MVLSEGDRIGRYQIVGALGAGGMGEVYRATDTSLKRQVAIKVLPQAFAADPERVARFQREAEVLAALNHPGIALIHGVEDADGVRALVMELVEGPTLADRIAQGPIPIDDALRIAAQITAALEAAHDHGIVHRDLKPANIKLRPDGTVKVLDFGLAKPMPPPVPSVDAMNSPTITSPVALSLAGVLLGTAAYMAPEQAIGQSSNKRVDVWAFGCVLFEMLTGSRAFPGADVHDTLASILASAPDWKALPRQTPAVIHRLLRRCLEKAPSKRLRDLGDAGLDIASALTGESEPAGPSTSPPGARRLTPIRVATALGVLAVIAGAVAFAIVRDFRGRASPLPPMELAMMFSSTARWDSRLRHFALSPDGRSLAFVGADGGLWLRMLDQSEPRRLPATEGAWDPFFSPDGEWVGFIDAGPWGGGFLIKPGQLKKVAVRGGAPVFLGDVLALGASWGPDDTIVCSRQTDHGVALVTIPASGGSPRPLTSPASAAVRAGWPSRLPDGDTLLFSETDQDSFRSGHIVALSLRTGDRRTVVEQGYAGRYVPGHLVYVQAGNIMAVRFDPDRRQTSGVPVSVVNGIFGEVFSGWAGMSVSESGLLLYDSLANTSNGPKTLEWASRNGNGPAILSEPGEYSYPRLSPDGRRLSVGAGGDIWILDLTRGTRNRIAAKDRGTTPTPPVSAWTADGRHLAISRRSGADVRIDVVDPDDVEQSTTIVRRQHLVQLGSWSKNGTLAFFAFSGATERDVWMLEPGTPEPRPFLTTRFNERGAVFSPDGHWVAYVADTTGRDEIYLRAYPGPGAAVPVSTGGGLEPVWSRDGHTIFYRTGDRMMAVSAGSGRVPSPGRPEVVFERPFATSDLGVADFDVASDGRFIMVKPIDGGVRRTDLVAVVNWFESLKAKTAAK